MLYLAPTAAQVHAMGEHFLRRGNIRCALLTFDAWSNLVRPSELEGITDPGFVMRSLRPYQMFGSLLRQVTRNALPIHDKAFRHLVGIDSGTASDGREDVTVLSHSFIYRWAVSHSSATTNFRPGDPLSVGVNLVEKWVRRALLLRLNTLLVWLHSSAMRSGAFRLCDNYIRDGKCKPLAQCNFYHPSAGHISAIEFNRQLGIHLHLIAILDYFAAVEAGYDEERSRNGMQRYARVSNDNLPPSSLT